MNRNKTGISADGICDMPAEDIRANRIGIIHFYVTIGKGTFLDGKEISSVNIAECYKNGMTELVTSVPEPSEYADHFREMLEKYDEIVHISAASGTSKAYERAIEALEMLGESAQRVKVVDSRSISSGMALLILKAAELRDSDQSASHIVHELEKLREDLNVSFIADNTSQMYRNGRVSKTVDKLCRIFRFRPVFAVESGVTKFVGICTGSRARSIKSYIRRRLRGRYSIDKRHLFITHVGLSLGELAMIKNEAAKYTDFEEVTVTGASAVVSANSGEGTVGILFLSKH